MGSKFEAGTNEIHGLYGQEIDEPFAHLLGKAVGTRLAGGRLVVGGDLRPTTPLLKQALIRGALETGCEVYDVGILPTPVLYFAKDRLWADGAIMVTGSHHAPQENGFSITLGKLPTSEVELHQLQEQIENRGPFASGAGELYTHDILRPYASFMVARFVPVDPLPVVMDANHGSMSILAPTTLRILGYDLRDCNDSAETTAETAHPDPFLPQNLSRLSKQVLACHAHVGVAYDGDGDQVVFANERGRILTPEQTLVLLARALLLYQPGSQVVYQDSFAPFVAHEILKVGGRPEPLPLSSAGIKRTLLERGAVLGADDRGRYFFRTMGGDDALYATLVLLRIVSRYEGKLEPLITDLH